MIASFIPEAASLGETLLIVLAMLFQIALLCFVIYWTMRLLKGAPGLWQLCVIVVTLAILHLLADLCNLEEIKWLLDALFKSLPLIIVVLFTEEIRRVFGKFTRKLQNTFFSRHSSGTHYEEELIDGLCTTIESLAASQTGALIAMEQVMDLEPYCRTGKMLDAELSGGNELLETIFFKGSPLHDGGVIIRRGRIEAAACIFPVSQDKFQPQDNFGLRHRAALGLSQQTDALVLVVSEETGAVHIALNGSLKTIVTGEQMKDSLMQCFLINSKKDDVPWYSRFSEAFKRVRAFFVLGRKMIKKGDKKD